jgi:hypothetical protein
MMPLTARDAAIGGTARILHQRRPPEQTALSSTSFAGVTPGGLTKRSASRVLECKTQPGSRILTMMS